MVVWTILQGDGTKYDSGTSLACAHVSGVVALMLQRNPSLSIADVREIIAKSAKKIGSIPYDTYKDGELWNQYYGFGLVDAFKAVLRTPRKN